MSVDANALERETLEKKDRDELAKIAGAAIIAVAAATLP